MKNAAIIIAIVLLAGGGGYLFFYKEPKPVPVKSEQKRQELKLRDTVEGEQYRKDTARMASENRALKRALAERIGKDKAATTKAQQSALNYNKTPTLANCNEALSDCQEENESKSGVIDLQYLMLAGKDIEQQRDRQEIGRLNAVRDSAFAGWGAANEALKKAGKPKRFGLGITAGYGLSKHGINPVIAVGINYNLARF